MQSVVFARAGGASPSPDWIARRLKPAGKTMDADTRALLTFLAGSELTRLAGELDKLIAFAGDRAEITEDDVRQIVPPSAEYSIFQLLDKLLGGDLRGAQEMRAALFLGGMNAVRVLSTLTTLLRQLAHMRRGRDAGTIAAGHAKAAGHDLLPCPSGRGRQCMTHSARGTAVVLRGEPGGGVRRQERQAARFRGAGHGFFQNCRAQNLLQHATNAIMISSKR